MSEWIRVEDSLPKENEKVLVCCRDGYIAIDKITNPKDWNLWACINIADITHWAPLPLPPKMEINK